MSQTIKSPPATTSVCNVRVFGVECGLLNVEDADIRVNILFAEYHEFDNWDRYDRNVALPNWVDFLLDKHVMGKKLALSAELVVKANRVNLPVYLAPFAPFNKLQEEHHGSYNAISGR